MKNREKESPSTITQLASALAVLDMGESSEAIHQEEINRLGGKDFYRRFLANALLGAALTEAMLADSEGAPDEQIASAHRQTWITAGVEDNPGKLLNFLRWQTLRIGEPLQDFAQNKEIGQIPLAAAHATQAIQLLLGICAQGQNLEHTSPLALTDDLRAAHMMLNSATKLVEEMLTLIRKARNL